jgi:5-oxopent-3-ene-1,2,5-tricarboxylate decarboxylase/2-hydroxyhepta-2,4-diene-1,7-dioate isomerase
MKHARIEIDGAIHDAVAVEGRLQLADGRSVAETDVRWLPPLEPTTRPRTIFAVAANYTDRSEHLAFTPPYEPQIYLKGSNTLVGHRSRTWRPDEVTYMHYECELAVVIGRTARRVTRADAYEHVAGYTVANDYMVRDYLENYHRPNLRAKGRDACTPIGPWLVDAADIRNPMSLRQTTYVNGAVKERGNTGDMIFDIAYLIAHLSGFMTLSPGDVILTGNAGGGVGVHAGDEVVTEIDGIGRLVNTIVGDDRRNS